MPRKLKIQLEISLEDLESISTLDGLVAWAEGVRAGVPPEHRSACVIEYESAWSDSSASLSGWYERDETDAERQKRERDERERAAKYQAALYEREREMYERLKAKFEPKT